MKILHVDFILLTSPYYGEGWSRSYGVVKVTTDDGRVGFGEPYAAVNMPTVCREAVRCLRPLLLGKTVEPIGPLMTGIHRVCEYFDHRGMIYCLLGAIDWALHDLAAQRAAVPLHRFLNSGSAESVPLYASTGPTDWSMTEMGDHLDRCFEEGFRIAKIRVGCCQQNVEEAIRRAQQVASKLGGRMALGVDAGQQIFFADRCWSLAEATRLAEAVGEFGAAFLEDALIIHDFDGYRKLKALNKVPIAGGEMFAEAADFERYMDGDALDIAQPDASVVPGPQACLRIGAFARRKKIRVAMHAWAGPVAQMQNLHAALAVGDCSFVEFCTLEHPLLREAISPSWRFEEGRFLAPTAPGMGVVILPETEHRFAFQDRPTSLIA